MRWAEELNFSSKTGKLSHKGPEFVTYRKRGTATTPDIVLSDNKAIHNIQIKPGPLTTSHHIPIITEITARKITEKNNITLNTKDADWN